MEPGFLLVSLYFLLLSILGCGSVGPEPRAKAFGRAIERYVCFQNFWRGREWYQLGHAILVDLRYEDQRAFVWAEGLSVVPGTSRWADFFALRERDGHVLVEDYIGFSIDLMRHNINYGRHRDLVYRDKIEKIIVHLPATCAPQPLPGTALKWHML